MDLHEILYGTVHERLSRHLVFHSDQTGAMAADTKTSCISVYVINYIPGLHMQSACHTFHADTSYKNEVSLYHFISMSQNWKFYTPYWLALYPSSTITVAYNSTCRLFIVLLLGFV